MQANGRHTPLDTMRLPDETKAIRRRVEALLAREVKAEGSAERGFDNVLRELTYTLLNRLVGLKTIWNDRLAIVRSSCASTRQGGRGRLRFAG